LELGDDFFLSLYVRLRVFQQPEKEASKESTWRKVQRVAAVAAAIVLLSLVERTRRTKTTNFYCWTSLYYDATVL
jgi:hypothetical protein